jgi:hypothetical protein
MNPVQTVFDVLSSDGKTSLRLDTYQTNFVLIEPSLRRLILSQIDLCIDKSNSAFYSRIHNRQ